MPRDSQVPRWETPPISLAVHLMFAPLLLVPLLTFPHSQFDVFCHAPFFLDRFTTTHFLQQCHRSSLTPFSPVQPPRWFMHRTATHP